MLRILFISILLITAGYLVLQEKAAEIKTDLPLFLVTDTIAKKHESRILVTVNNHSIYKPDSIQIETVIQDYSNLWAHLNHLYQTNDVLAGREYVTEQWFRQACSHYKGLQPIGVQRHDEEHHLSIQNWASDGLIYTAIDSNLIFRYTYPDQSIKTTSAILALVMLYQGDHWRVDAMRVIEEKELTAENQAGLLSQIEKKSDFFLLRRFFCFALAYYSLFFSNLYYWQAN